MVLWHFKLFRERQTTQTLVSGVKCKTENYTDTLTEESASVYTVEVFKNPSPVRIRPKEEYLPPPRRDGREFTKQCQMSRNNAKKRKLRPKPFSGAPVCML